MRILLIVLSIIILNHSLVVAQMPKLKEIKKEKTVGKIVPTEKKGKYGYVNQDGKFIIKPVFDFASDFLDDKYAIVGASGKFNIINKRSRYMLQQNMDSIYHVNLYNNPFYIFCINGKKGVMSDSLEVLINPDYVDIQPFSLDSITFVVKTEKNKYAFYQLAHGFYAAYEWEGKYDDIFWSNEKQLYIIRDDSLYGYADKSCETFVYPRLDKEPEFGTGVIEYYDEEQKEPKAFTLQGELSIMDYDDYIFKSLGEKSYKKNKTLPSWAKRHIKQAVTDSVIRGSQCLFRYGRVLSSNIFFEPRGNGKFPSVIKEKSGDNEYWHNIIRMSYFNDVAICLYKEYETNIYKLYSFNISQKSNYRPDLFLNKSKTITYKSLLQSIIDSEDLVSGDRVYLIQFGQLTNGNFIISLGLKYNGENVVIGYDIPQYTTIQGQLVMVNDGVYESTVYDYCEYALIVTPHGEVINTLRLPDGRYNQILIDNEGGFYCVGAGKHIGDFDICSRNTKMVLNESSPLLKFTNDGKLAWRYFPNEGETINDFEGTQDSLYLVGKTTSQGVIGHNNALFRTLSNDGIVCSSEIRKGSDEFKYVKTNLGGIYISSHDDVFYIYKKIYKPYLKCVWQKWGKGEIGGCGLYDAYTEEWLIPPVLEGSYNPGRWREWKIFPFEGDRARIINGEDEYMIDRNAHREKEQ